MKKILLIVLGVSLGLSGFSQSKSFVKGPTIGVDLMVHDFKTAANIRNSNSLNSLAINKQFTKFNDMDPALSVYYMQGFNDHIDFKGTITGSSLRYRFENKPRAANDEFLIEADATVNVKLLSDKHPVRPYLSIGVGGSFYDGYFGGYIPFGGGIQVRLNSETMVVTQAQYRVGISENVSDHFSFSLGFAITYPSKRK